MAELENPYDCSSPGNLFTGYDSARRRIMRGLRNGGSFAILGGRRCGKTSFLLQMEKDLYAESSGNNRLLPRLLDMQAFTPRSSADFFRAVYDTTVQDIGPPPAEVSGYQSFLTVLDRVSPALERHYGSDWIIVLLIDEFETAIERLPDSECIENLRNLLTLSRFKRHFRAIIAGVFSPSELQAKGSPLNNLNPEYLSILSNEEAQSLITVGFADRLAEPLASSVMEQSGRHPYILQGVLGYLWDCEVVTDSNLQAAGRRFVRDREGTFRRWLETFKRDGCALYQSLIDNNHRSSVNPNSLAVLGYHCVIDESTSGEVRIGSTIFRDWFRANYGLSKEPASVMLEQPKIESRPLGKRVFVVHGRNIKIRNSLFTFLKVLGLEPLDWTALVELTGNPTPHINEILRVGFKFANSAVVLLTPDDEARVREEFRMPDDSEYERKLTPQPRQNVLFEAGMAMAYFPDRTVLLQVGSSRPFSDIAGVHLIKLDNSLERRRDFAKRLKMAGCEIVDLNTSIDWQNAGDFSL
jgi:predicted nucleotide-binding protein